MRHSGYRHFDPAKHDGHENSKTGFYIHAFLLVCWLLTSMHWAWVWYTKRRDARRETYEERSGFPLYIIQLRDGRWENCEDEVGLLLRRGDIRI